MQHRTIMRVDFNIPDIQNIQRIKAVVPDIIEEAKKGFQVILCTHWARPRGFQQTYSTKLFIPVLKELLSEHKIKLTYWNQYENGFDTMPDDQLILLENTRFDFRERGDHTQRLQVAREYASWAHSYIDNAFSLSHRQEATNTEIKQFLPHTYGSLYLSELYRIQTFLASPKEPFIAILGGGKAKTKFPLLKALLPFVDHILVGGALSYPFLRTARPAKLGGIEVNSEDVYEAEELLLSYPEKLVIPVDTVMYEGGAMDIGIETRQLFQEYIEKAGKIFWNGPVGNYKLSGMQYGTQAIVNALASHTNNPELLVAGGDTLSCIRSSSITSISYGGGATTHQLIQQLACS